MNTLNDGNYRFSVLPGTRDHRGFFVQDTTYELVDVSDGGWARICLDSAACYYVDPENIKPS
ncbi:MAG: hypothetical protein DCF21_03945 [Leptolyngbya sp.]|jgi:hypothetical protein|uniref:Uncharacterized protein n=1 Tax=Shackletoniella antarctica TaxID=268115 RepID=A0A2W4YSF3_9CYAN|nr:MAG: hypothetical protein DCF17_00095 [Shackletoniella antarctica]PZV20794.1 MAG: hypothetical protein DCF21_03945 [Leptolyngbya sp.]